MRRHCNGGQAMTALLLVSLLATASAGHLRSPSHFHRSLLANPPEPTPTTSLTYRATDSPATVSGLQDADATGDAPVTVGHYLTNVGLFASTPYSAPTQTGGQKTHSGTFDTGVWGQEISYSAANINGVTRPDIFEDSTALNGVTIDSVKFNQQDNVWMVDRKMGNAYKIVSDSGSSTPGGIFQTSPGRIRPLTHTDTDPCVHAGMAAASCLQQVSDWRAYGPSAPTMADPPAGAVEQPIVVAVDSAGDAWVRCRPRMLSSNPVHECYLRMLSANALPQQLEMSSYI